MDRIAGASKEAVEEAITATQDTATTRTERWPSPNDLVNTAVGPPSLTGVVWVCVVGLGMLAMC